MSMTHAPRQSPLDGATPDAVAGRIVRLMQLMQHVQDKRGRTADQLAELLKVSRRTVFRDVRTLQAAGIPLINDSRMGYMMREGFTAARLDLKASEMLGLLLLGKVAEALPDQPLLGSAAKAVEKLIAQLPEATRRICGELMADVSFAPGEMSITRDDEAIYRECQYAIDQRLICTAGYHAMGEDEIETFELHPLHLHFWRRAWYVFAYCPAYDQVRTFKLSRFHAFESREECSPPREFSLEAHLDGAWGLIPEGRVHDIAIRFLPKVARNVADIKWHPSQETAFEQDGSCVMRFRVNGLTEIKWWIMGYGDQAVVLAPVELKAELRAMALAQAALYEDE